MLKPNFALNWVHTHNSGGCLCKDKAIQGILILAAVLLDLYCGALAV